MLKYLHNGFLRGIPARNLTDEEVKQYGKKRLLDSGLYEEKRERKPKKEIEVKAPDAQPQAEE